MIRVVLGLLTTTQSELRFIFYRPDRWYLQAHRADSAQ